MNKIVVLAVLLIASEASAQNAGDYFQPQLTSSTGCARVVVRWAPSGIPNAPYPAMNILRASLDNSPGKLIVVNIEMETQTFGYQGSKNCPLLITLPPNLTIGQGFYGGIARFTGFMTKGYTHFGIRTAGGNRAALIASGPGVTDKAVTLGDMCTGSVPRCEIILRAMLMWFEPP
jgi:hypothetical protein